MADDREFQFYANRRTDKTYVSRPFPGQLGRTIRIRTKAYEYDEGYFLTQVDGEEVIWKSPGGRDEVKVIFYTDDRQIERVHFVRFSNGKPDDRVQFTLDEDALRKLRLAFRALNRLPIEDGGGKVRLDDDLLGEVFADMLDDPNVRSLLREHEHVVRQVVKNDLTEQDIVGVAYRKKQLGVFEQMLSDNAFFRQMKSEWGKTRDEDVWQEFFEKNTWIFGYGLNYIFTSSLDSQRLEQVVAGFSVSGAGKRVDGLLKTRGAISSTCFVEIKRPSDRLLEAKSYRKECWPPSAALSGAVCQVQKSVQKALEHIGTRLRPKDKEGYSTAEECFLYQPKAFVLIGSLDEFRKGEFIADEQYASFELYRRNLANPEVVTFDELLERAKHIVAHTEEAFDQCESRAEDPIAAYDEFGPPDEGNQAKESPSPNGWCDDTPYDLPDDDVPF